MRIKTKKIASIIVAVAALAFSALGQEESPAPSPTPEAVRPNAQVRILRELGLTPEQVQQIRRINAERRPVTQEAQEKLRAANRALDDAIYANTFSEEDIKTRMRDVQLAQAEVTKVRTLTEVMIRKVLNPEQLEKFRNLRDRLMNRPRNPAPQTRPAERIRDRRQTRPQN